MNIVICWSNISGYMAACWRQLASVPRVNVFLIGFASDSVAPFDPALLGDIPHVLMDERQRVDADFVRKAVIDRRPDVLVVSGWAHAAYRRLSHDAELKGVTRIMAMDTPARGDFRQAVGRYLLKGYLRHFDSIMVPGERAFSYAKYLGFLDGQIRKGLYGIDFPAFASCSAEREGRAWPRAFLYVGRYAKEKGLDTLVEAYGEYRRSEDAPWDLVCCGRGPEASRLAVPGVKDLGFVPPDRQAAVFAGAGAFVMPSRYEPWGVAIAEAAAAGLPLICSTACGAGVELLRDGFNGYTFATDDAAGLARRLKQIHHAPGLREWGTRSRTMASAYDSALWPARLLDGHLPG